MLETAAPYLEKPPTRADVLSDVRRHAAARAPRRTRNTASLSRDHTILIDASRLVTITGGKWTTYRKMAEDTVDHGRRARAAAASGRA